MNKFSGSHLIIFSVLAIASSPIRLMLDRNFALAIQIVFCGIGSNLIIRLADKVPGFGQIERFSPRIQWGVGGIFLLLALFVNLVIHRVGV